VVNMSNIFNQATSFNNAIGNWDTSRVTNMSSMFKNTHAFNQAIGGWSTFHVVDMSSMFESATAFNQAIGNWNTANVTTMKNMFNSAAAFNQAIGNWDTSQVTNMAMMFYNATVFNQPLGNWNVGNLTYASYMFSNVTLSRANYESLLTGLYTAERMRAMDKAAIEGAGIPGGHLMERAGVGVTREILGRFDPEFVIVYAGKGNNGGDGFVVARELTHAGVDVLVVAVAGRQGYTGDALLNLQILDKLQFTVLDGLPPEGDERLDLMDCDLVVDAIFGTGFSGAAHGPAADAIELINATPSPVGSIDIASGVDASSGEVAGPAVAADLTVTMHAAKVGHFVTPGGSLSGDVAIVPIGIPAGSEQEADVWLLDLPGLTPILRPKGALDHKRSVGTVLVVGGSRGMGGAAFLAAMGALRSGAGLVHVALPASAAAANSSPSRSRASGERRGTHVQLR